MPEEVSPSRSLDLIGLFCPEPLFRAREGIDKIEVGEVIEILADDPAADEDIHRFAKRAGHEVVLFEEKEDHMRFLIKRNK
jgi:TusA-related sulfurtransferase